VECSFDGTRAPLGGGGFSLTHNGQSNNVSTTIASSTFRNTMVPFAQQQSNGGGGAYVAFDESSANTVTHILNTTFTNCSAPYGIGAGAVGLFYRGPVTNNTEMLLDDVRIENSSAVGNSGGGGMMVLVQGAITGASLVVSRSTFTGNNASGVGGGGAMRVELPQDKPQNLVFSGFNDSSIWRKQSSGVESPRSGDDDMYDPIENYPLPLDFDDPCSGCGTYPNGCTSCPQFDPPNARYPIQAVQDTYRRWTTHNTIDISSSTFTNNTATYQGGAISVPGGGSVTIQNTTIGGNDATANLGGGISIGGTVLLKVINSTLRRNTCGKRGTQIFSSSGADIVFGSGSVVELSCDTDGFCKQGFYANEAGSLKWDTQCYEVQVSLSHCHGFPSCGYTCVGDWCAAMADTCDGSFEHRGKCSCAMCAKPAGAGSVVNASSGRCIRAPTSYQPSVATCPAGYQLLDSSVIGYRTTFESWKLEPPSVFPPGCNLGSMTRQPDKHHPTPFHSNCSIVQENSNCPCYFSNNPFGGKYSMGFGATTVIPYVLASTISYACRVCPAGHFNPTPPVAGTKHTSGIIGTCNPCPAGKFQSDIGQAVCKVCAANSHQNVTGRKACEPCPGGQFQPARGQPRCIVTCPDGIDCTGGVALQEEGWWRPTDSLTALTELYVCYQEHVCIGSEKQEEEHCTGAGGKSCLPDFDKQCKPGYEGPVCAMCADGFTRQGAGCEECAGFNGENVAGVVLLVLGTLALALFLYHKQRAEWCQPALLKILLTFIEMLSLLEETFAVAWPTFFSSVTGVVRAALGSVAQLSALSCAVHVNRYVQLMIWTLVMLSAALAIVGRYRWIVHHSAKRADSAARQQCVKRIFYLGFFCYPLVSPIITSIFQCREVAGVSYLEADYTLHCYEDWWPLVVAWSGLWSLLFVAGFPALAAVALHGRWPSAEFIAEHYHNHGVRRYFLNALRPPDHTLLLRVVAHTTTSRTTTFLRHILAQQVLGNCGHAQEGVAYFVHPRLRGGHARAHRHGCADRWRLPAATCALPALPLTVAQPPRDSGADGADVDLLRRAPD
jgi:predicted outer membrane repeat protein